MKSWLAKRGLQRVTDKARNAMQMHLHTDDAYVCGASEVVKERVDCVVIGAGVVGLAIARKLARVGRDVLVLEAAPCIGTGISSRNSEVIHGGIYYPAGSLKARLCVEGKKALYSYCLDHGIPHKRLGKLIVATSSGHTSVLENLLKRGRENSLEDLRIMSGDEARQMEPELRCVKALWSPSTGILDSHALMMALQADAEEHGTTFCFNSLVLGGVIAEKTLELHVCNTPDFTPGSSYNYNSKKIILCADSVVNASGLSAPILAKRMKGFPLDLVPESYFARGCYFTLSGIGKTPFSHLIYPVPEEGGLGIHVTLDLGGQIRFGPDVEWLDNIEEYMALKYEFDYIVDPDRSQKFYPEIRKYYPSLLDGMLKPDYAGIRPKISGPGQPPADFVIQGEASHRVHGLVNLFGIESPGLTSCFAIADMINLILR